jgi:hypothetical protein
MSIDLNPLTLGAVDLGNTVCPCGGFTGLLGWCYLFFCRPPKIMPQATFRFYEELNDYLPEERRKRDFPVSFGPGSTVRDILASLGISRCPECNEMLDPATEEDETHAGPSRMKERRATFAPCPFCNRVHREEGHFGRMSSFVRELSGAGLKDRASSC